MTPRMVRVRRSLHFWWNRTVGAATASVDFVSAACRCGMALSLDPALGVWAPRLGELSRRLAPVARAAAEVGTPLGIDDLVEYFRLYFLSRERRLTASAALVDAHRAELAELLELLGGLDAAAVVGAFRRAQPSWCRPGLSSQRPFTLEGVRHPLLGQDAVANDLELTRGLLVTGSNMSGKSTFLRAAGLNVLFAQSLGFSCATSHLGPLLRVVTSLRASDRLSDGKSYYLAEAQRIGLLLAAAGPEVLLLIDEPFRGTNSAERIAASVAVLRHARRAGALVMAATHDLELTQLLADEYERGYFQDGLDDRGLHFDFRLRPGVAIEHNAIRLLAYLRYPSSLVDEAQALVGALTSFEVARLSPSDEGRAADALRRNA